MKRTILIIAAICALIFAGEGQSVNRKAPSFALFDMEGKLVTLSNLTREGNVILSFWASYCKPCIREMPQLIELAGKYEKSNNIKLVLVNIDKEGKDKAQPVLQQMNVQNACLLDVYQVAAKSYIPNLKVPALFLVTKTGMIVFEEVGEKPDVLQKLEKVIQKMK
jgi:cytochrome c biogenesis protein CcmG, thiol:disulfide interchange protein DsbE